MQSVCTEMRINAVTAGRACERILVIAEREDNLQLKRLAIIAAYAVAEILECLPEGDAE